MQDKLRVSPGVLPNLCERLFGAILNNHHFRLSLGLSMTHLGKWRSACLPHFQQHRFQISTPSSQCCWIYFKCRYCKLRLSIFFPFCFNLCAKVIFWCRTKLWNEYTLSKLKVISLKQQIGIVQFMTYIFFNLFNIKQFLGAWKESVLRWI